VIVLSLFVKSIPEILISFTSPGLIVSVLFCTINFSPSGFSPKFIPSIIILFVSNSVIPVPTSSILYIKGVAPPLFSFNVNVVLSNVNVTLVLSNDTILSSSILIVSSFSTPEILISFTSPGLTSINSLGFHWE